MVRQARAAAKVGVVLAIAWFSGTSLAQNVGPVTVLSPTAANFNVTIGGGSLAANQSVNVAQIAGSTASTAATGVLKVGVVGNAGGPFDAATGAAPPANALYVAGLASGATAGLLGTLTICDQWVGINGTASAQLITGVSGRKIYFCSGNIQMNGGANTVSFVSGTGTTCATGTTAVPGFDGATTAANGYSFAANSGMSFGGGIAPFARTTNNADNFCILVGSATRVVGGLNYAIY